MKAISNLIKARIGFELVILAKKKKVSITKGLCWALTLFSMNLSLSNPVTRD